MAYRVDVSRSARREADEAFRWVERRSARQAARWAEGFRAAVRSLADNPERCGLAPESEAFAEPIRQLLYGKRGNVYRILFVVSEGVVHVLHVRHAARPFLEP